jgi:hypothetical protein
MVWDASAGAVRASYWRTTVDEDGHYKLRRGVRQSAPHHHEAQQCRRPQGLDATFLRRRWYRVFAPEVDPPCLRASPVREAWPRWLRPYRRLLQNRTTLGSLRDRKDFCWIKRYWRPSGAFGYRPGPWSRRLNAKMVPGSKPGRLSTT